MTNVRASAGDVFNIGSARPFQRYAQKYLEAGWHPIILPPGQKAPPPVGFTGRYDGIADEKQIRSWPKDSAYGAKANLGFRAPDGVLGIDVDNYQGDKKPKIGATSLAEMVGEFGKLPDTWVSTARADGASGIRWFKVPSGLIWPGKLGTDIESVSFRYRFAVAPPSIHPKLKLPYLWYEPGYALNGDGAVDVIPSPELDLPDLPEAWVEGLQQGLWSAKPYDTTTSRSEFKPWLLERPRDGLCPNMRAALDSTLEELDGAGSAHETLNTRLYYMIRLSAEGHSGIVEALQKTFDAFKHEVTDRARSGSVRSEKDAYDEYLRSRDGAIRLVLGSMKAGDGSELRDECTCYIPSLSSRGTAKDPLKYGMTELDNAYHIRDLNDGNIRFFPREDRNGAWAIWSEEDLCWYWSGTKAGPSIGRLVQIGAEEYAEAVEHAWAVEEREARKEAQQQGADEAKSKQVAYNAARSLLGPAMKWAATRKSSNNKRGTISQLSEFPELTADVSEFDADPFLLQFPNGVLDLRAGSVERGVRPCAREDFMLRRMAFPYIETAMSRLWEEYLASSIPDDDVRDYLHRLAGYTLIGRNTHKKAVFLIGESNSGKSVFVDVMRKVFGTYGHTFDLALMRSRKEAGPRSDLLNAIPARMLAANESSERSSLHADELKRLTGGDEIAATAKFSNVEINATPAFTPWISSQEVPHIKVDKAIMNRIEPIVFPKEFKPKQYKEGSLSDAILGRAGEAVTAWLVDGLLKFHERGLTGRPGSLQESSENFALDASGHIGNFVRDCLVRTDSKEDFMWNHEIENLYHMWCSMHQNEMSRHEGALNSRALGKALSGLNYGKPGNKWNPETKTSPRGRAFIKLASGWDRVNNA